MKHSLQSILRIRALVITVQALTLYFTSGWLGLELQIAPLALLFVYAGASNIYLSFSRKESYEESFLGTLVIFDVILLSFMLHFSSGPENPFSILYLLHVVVAALFLDQRWTWGIVALSISSFGVLLLLHIPGANAEHAGHSVTHLHTHLVGMWLAYALVAVITASGMTRISKELRRTAAEAAVLKVNQQRLASLTTLAAGAAHELATPLGTALIALGEMERQLQILPTNEDLISDLSLAKEQITRCKSIISQMGNCSGEVAGEAVAQTSLQSFVRELSENLQASFGTAVETVATTADVSIRIPPRAIVQAVAALTKNAVEASPLERRVRVEASATVAGLLVRVKDRGEGIAPEMLERIGEPFFSTKAPGAGMGLGVFLARLTTESLGGTFLLRSALGEGTVAEMSVPSQRN